VTKTLRDMGPAKLWPAEQAIVRDAADALVFATDLSSEEARMALAAVVVLTDELIDAERWTASRAQELLDDVWACGPGKAFGLPVAA
jgi:outer membrane cobalamin receptor